MADSEHIVCSHCGGINRVPVSRDSKAAQCGKCKRALFSSQPQEVDDAMLQRQITRSDIPVLVDFWAPWCGPCRMMGPAFAAAAGQLEPNARLLKLNTEAHQAMAGQLGIRSIPTMILFKNGREVERVSGALDTNAIVRWARQHF